MAQYITSEAELTALYGPHDTIVATIKEIDHISEHYRMFIELSPFVLVATSGPGGLDCTPRGDPAGFVRVVDKHTLMLPDRRGNNRRYSEKPCARSSHRAAFSHSRDRPNAPR